MADTLYRYDEPTSQWVPVANMHRIEVSGGGGGGMFENMPFFTPPELSTINEIDLVM